MLKAREASMLPVIGVLMMITHGGQTQQVPGKAPETAGAQNFYWPLKQGNTWRYAAFTGTDGSKASNDNDETIQTITKVVSVPDQSSLVSLALTMKGRVAGADQYLLKAGQIYEAAISIGMEKLAPNRLFLKSDLKPGMVWDWKGTDDVLGEKTRETCHFAVVGPEQIKTPAGVFQTLHLKQTIAGDANAGTRDYWFAKNVGIVQTRRTLGAFIVYTKLTAYKLMP